MFIEHVLCQALFVLGPGNKAVSKLLKSLPSWISQSDQVERKQIHHPMARVISAKEKNGTGPEDGGGTGYRGWVSPQMARGWSEKFLRRETLGTGCGAMRDVREDISRLQN